MRRSIYTREERGWGTELDLFSDLLEEITDPEVELNELTVTKPMAPIESKFATECGVNLYLDTCVLGMADSFGDPESDDTIEARRWCMEDMPEVWEGMTNSYPRRILIWLESMWAYTDSNETERNSIKRLLHSVRARQGSNQNMTRRTDD